MKMIFIPLALSILVPALAAANTTGTPDPSAIAAAAERAIEVASMWSDAGALKAATRTLDDALTRAPDDAALLYTRGFAYYAESLSLYRDPKNRVAMKRCLDKGVDELERVKGAPWETEAVALEANLLGSLIGFQDDPAMAGATFGMKSAVCLARLRLPHPGIRGFSCFAARRSCSPRLNMVAIRRSVSPQSRRPSITLPATARLLPSALGARAGPRLARPGAPADG